MRSSRRFLLLGEKSLSCTRPPIAVQLSYSRTAVCKDVEPVADLMPYLRWPCMQACNTIHHGRAGREDVGAIARPDVPFGKSEGHAVCGKLGSPRLIMI